MAIYLQFCDNSGQNHSKTGINGVPVLRQIDSKTEINKSDIQNAFHMVKSNQEITHKGSERMDANKLEENNATYKKWFTEDGQLREIPTKEKNKLKVLQWFAMNVFTASEEYTEKEVNERISRYHQDTAYIRRMLVDYKFMTRERDGSSYRLLPECEK